MKTKTSKLEGAALDWAVARAQNMDYFHPDTGPAEPAYSTNWSLAGPIIERELIELGFDGEEWYANKYDLTNPEGEIYLCGDEGPTPLIAAMRCYVASKLGGEVDIPDELTR